MSNYLSSGKERSGLEKKPTAAGTDPSLEVIRRLPIFAALADQELAALRPVLRRRTFQRGQVVFREGEPVTAIHFLAAGRVKILAVTADGREQTLTILEPGDFFPHLGFLAGGAYPATAVALDEVVLFLVEREPLIDLLRRNSDLALAMVLKMARRLDDLQQRVRELAERDLRVRVARALLHLVERHGRPGDRCTCLDLRLTHQELASLTGTARESVSRTLGTLRREGVLGGEQGALVILDPQALRAIADGLR